MGAAARRGRLTDTEAVLFSVSVFNFQLSILSFQFYPRRLPLPSALGPRPSSLTLGPLVYKVNNFYTAFLGVVYSVGGAARGLLKIADTDARTIDQGSVSLLHTKPSIMLTQHRYLVGSALYLFVVHPIYLVPAVGLLGAGKNKGKLYFGMTLPCGKDRHCRYGIEALSATCTKGFYTLFNKYFKLLVEPALYIHILFGRNFPMTRKAASGFSHKHLRKLLFFLLYTTFPLGARILFDGTAGIIVKQYLLVAFPLLCQVVCAVLAHSYSVAVAPYRKGIDTLLIFDVEIG